MNAGTQATSVITVVMMTRIMRITIILARVYHQHNVQSILYSVTKPKSCQKGFGFIPTLVKVNVNLQVQVKLQQQQNEMKNKFKMYRKRKLKEKV